MLYLFVNNLSSCLTTFVFSHGITSNTAHLSYFIHIEELSYSFLSWDQLLIFILALAFSKVINVSERVPLVWSFFASITSFGTSPFHHNHFPHLPVALLSSSDYISRVSWTVTIFSSYTPFILDSNFAVSNYHFSFLLYICIFMDIKVDLTKVIGWSENSRPIEENNGRKKM